MKDNDGTYLQNRIWAALLLLQEQYPAVCHRYLDAKAARNAVKHAPADFYLLHKGIFWLIECKSTVTGATLRSLAKHSAVGRRQLAEARKVIRAGGRSLFVYANLTAKGECVSFHDSEDLLNDWWDRPLMRVQLSVLESQDATALALLEVMRED